jgi:hypothetical protein
MNKRIYYYEDQGRIAFEHVLVARPKGVGDVYVYCPPSLSHGPWCERFDTFDQAMDLAGLLSKQSRQDVVLVTRDPVEWWLEGLTIIGDSDDYYRHIGVDD